MPLDLTTDCTFTGPALPEPFVKFNLEAELNRLSLLPKTTGADARALDEQCSSSAASSASSPRTYRQPGPKARNSPAQGSASPRAQPWVTSPPKSTSPVRAAP